MALGKVFIVLDFDSEEQKAQVQDILKEISNERILTGRQIVSVAPIVRKNKSEIAQLFTMIKEGGIKSLMSVKGGMLISKMSKK
ncbi:hypothetical protein [Phocaeicola plebeius]|jgi:uncharacterized membrane protein|uniref:hypothetical protein n=1 Tax=Phocaeicola plebeius TaxID=310297 RepID=UPI002070262B|nr:hypothetical protein [Phocaeicola plebeius]DAV44015.1 MAG TPA: hypothetical protein [Caudoviricetes sp.]